MIPRDKRLGRYGIITLSASLLVSLVAVAGSLTPPGVPASTMRTLQEIYDTVAGTFDSSAISSDPDGSVIQGLKYITENLSWSLSGSDIYNNNVGNVGIGTTAPLTKLDIIGDVLVRALPPTLGAPVFFTHANFSSDEDAIDASVHLTRGTSGPLYNALTEGSSDYDTSPENTEWNADGFSNIGDLRTRTYGAFGPVVFNAFGSLQFIVGKELVMHIISSDTYYKVVFSQWTNGAAGGGFEYTRTQVIFTDGSNVRIGTQDASGTLEIVGRASISGVALAGTFTSPGTGADSEKFGLNAVADSIGSIAIGNNARALSGGFGSGTNSLVIGASAIVSNQASVVIGAFASDSMATIAGENVIIGAEALMTGGAYYGTIIGKSASGSEEGPTAIGYFAEAVGDSIAIGRNASSRKSTIAIGIGARTTAAGQMVIGDQGDGVDGPISDVYIGRGVTATSPQNVTINSTGGNGTDIAGGDLTFAGGKPTGAGDGGNIIFSTAQAGSSGTTLRSLNERMRIDQFGNVGIGTTDPSLYKVQIATSGTSNQSMLAAYDADSIIFDVFTSSTDGVARVINGSAVPRVQLHSNGNSYFMGGNVGIGTTAPETDFELVGTASVSAITGSAFTGISNCNLESQTLNWDSSTGRFSCLTDGTGTGGSAVGLREGFTGSFTNFSSISFNAPHFVLDTGNPDARLSLDWGTGGPASLSQNETVTGSWTFASNTTFSAGASMAGNFDPAVDDTYDLGDTSFRWRDIYLGPGSMHIGTSTADEYVLSYDTTSNSLGFNVNGSGNPEIVFDSAGNVGIGTTVPGTLLDFNGAVSVREMTAPALSPTGQGRIYFDSTADVFKVSENGNAYVNLIGSSGGAGGWTDDGSVVRLTTITDSVGIGTTAPAEKLHIFNSANSSTGIEVESTSGGASATSYFRFKTDVGNAYYGMDGSGTSSPRQQRAFVYSDTANGVSLQAVNASGVITFVTGADSMSNERMRIGATGNVGIGTTAPGANLHVRGPGSATTTSLALFQSNPSTATNLYMIDIEKSGVASLMMGINKNSTTGSVPASVPFITTNDTIQALSIGRGGANDLPNTSDIYIDTAGNIGISTTSPAQLLDIGGSAANITFSHATGPHQIITGGTSVLALMPGGNVGIGTTTAAAKLTVAGNLLFSAATPTISPSTAGTSLSVDSNGAGALNLNNTATGDIVMAGGVGATGCTLTNSTGAFSCAGNITTTATGTPTAGFWIRNTTSGFLYPSTIGDNIGIGTSAPAANLHVRGAGNTTGANNLAFFQSNPSTATNLYMMTIEKSGVASLMMGINKNSTTGSVPASVPFISTYATIQALSIGRGGANDLPSTSDIYIDTAGNIGIGTTAPAYDLHVNDASAGNVTITAQNTTNAAGSLAVFTAVSADSTGYFFIAPSGYTTLPILTDRFSMYSESDSAGINIVANGASGDIRMYTGAALAANERLRITDTGNVGIGDASPTSLFVVGATDAFQVNSSGRVQANVGASGAGNLAYSFVGDTDLGFYRSAADEMRFQTAGTDKVTINSAGNVGIGTTAPDFNLHVRGAGSTTLANNLAFFQSNPSTPTNLYMIAIEKTGVASLMMGVNKNSTTGSVPASVPFISTYATTQALSIGRGGANDLPNTSDIYIDTAGNVGIGTTTVGAKLAVEGNLLFTAATPTISPSTAGTSLSIDSNGTGALNLNNTATGDIVMAGGVGATGCTLTNSNGNFSCTGNITTTGIGTPTAGFWTRDTASGFLYPSTIGDNVGIGTSTGLTHKLKVEGKIFASTQATAVNEVVTAGRTISAGTGMSGGGALTGDLTLSSTTWSSSSSHIISLGGGNVGVGTGVVTPGSKLQVNGNTALGYSGSTVGPALGLTVSGNVGIGTITPTEKLEVIGNILASGNITTLTGTVSGASLSGTCNLAGEVNSDDPDPDPVTFTDSNCADYAEVYPSSEAVHPGDLLVLDTANPGKVKKASQANSANIMGIVSTSPAAIVGYGKFISGKIASEYDNPSHPAVALIGRVPVKASLENGPIAVGDHLAASSVPGVVTKANEAGISVGIALQPLNSVASGSYQKIMSFVNVGYWAPSVADVVGDSIEVSSGGGISDTDTIFSAIIYKFKETLEIVFEKGLIRVAKIITDILETKKLVADELQLKDSQTGEIYCVTIKNGEWNKAEGECGSGSFESTAPSLPDSSGSSDTPSIIPVPVDNFESSPSPSPTIESAPEPSAEPTPIPIQETTITPEATQP